MSGEAFIFVPSGRHKESCERDIPEDMLRGYELKLPIARFKVKYGEFPDIENSPSLR